ncbi:MAG: alpha/beta fold hydrolase [Parafilimonas terrae]|nr:alpha/beta fold hydrolase [Parafilimonas terrae]
MNWARDGRDWPNRGASRFVRVAGRTWHVQVMGEGPVLLLLHGTAASTHSFRDLARLLMPRFTVVIPDLPGHGFTQRPPDGGMTLPGMAAGVARLLDGLDLRPALAAGHSAGAAVLVRMALDRRFAPGRLVALNGALLPFGGVSGHVAPGLAKLLFLNPVAPRVFAFLAGEGTVTRMLASMGSRIDRRGVALYTRLMRDPAHVESALAMMAHWDLDGLSRELPELSVPLTLVVGGRDRAIPVEVAEAVRRRVPSAEVRVMPGLGHLAHEEDPGRIAALLTGLAEENQGRAPS